MDTKEDSTLGWAQPCKGSLIPRHHSSRNNPNRKAVKERWRLGVEVMRMRWGGMKMRVERGGVI